MDRMLSLELRADYHQIQLLDRDSETNLGDHWTEQGTTDGLVVADDTMAIVTEVNGPVAVLVHVLSEEPPAGDGFDHVVEAGINVPSGELIVMGPADYLPEADRVAVPPGWIGVRASRRNLAEAREAYDALDFSEPIEEIVLQLWPVGGPIQPRVVLRWSRGRTGE
jgi:hypothetical protein